ncbi:hypothetical protein N7491_011357 [Penicillium cf. griseofulvum]|nr:hypothetical protein N7491_011357 [Penicillium cf. griseofulvum]
MAYQPPVPKVTLPYHKRSVSTVGNILYGLFDTILPFVTALIIFVGIVFVCYVPCMTVADRLGYDVGIDKQRKKAQKKSEGQSEGESMAQGDGDGSGTGGKEEGSGKGRKLTRRNS